MYLCSITFFYSNFTPILANIVVESRFCKYIVQLFKNQPIFQIVAHFGLGNILVVKLDGKKLEEDLCGKLALRLYIRTKTLGI